MLSFILLLVRRQFKKIRFQTMVNRYSCPEPQMLFVHLFVIKSAIRTQGILLMDSDLPTCFI